MSTIWKGIFKAIIIFCMLNHFTLFMQLVQGPPGDPGSEGPPVSPLYYSYVCKNIISFNFIPHYTGKEGS